MTEILGLKGNNVKRKKGLDKAVIFLVLIILVLLGTGFFVFSLVKTDKITTALEKGKTLPILFLIKDGETLKYTELFLYNAETHKGSLFDIPGNVGSILSQVHKMGRIDTLFSVRKPFPYIKKVESLTGVRIPFYMIIDVHGISKIVDLFEGIKLFIPNPVEIIESPSLVLLPAGNVVLDGEKAVLFMDYKEKGEENVERISRRQKVLQALFVSIAKKNSFLNNRKLDSVLYSTMKTDLSKAAVVSFFREIKSLDTERMVFQRVLGAQRKIGNETLLFPHYEGKLLKETVSQTVESLANTETTGRNALHISIDILNGTGQNGLAGRTSRVFKSFGYDILNLGNYSTDNLEKTFVLSRSMDTEAADRIAEIIKCKNVKYANTIDISNTEILNDSSDVIVVLGKDFDGRYCKD